MADEKPTRGRPSKVDLLPDTTPHVRIVVASNLKISGGRRRQK
ncbi:Uncharacterised protein [Serratia ficaria]|nr:hypothetical protein [Serratia ficaria]CAI2794246.1 Uncharacterised protein [Serratia ficaria]